MSEIWPVKKPILSFSHRNAAKGVAHIWPFSYLLGSPPFFSSNDYTFQNSLIFFYILFNFLFDVVIAWYIKKTYKNTNIASNKHGF